MSLVYLNGQYLEKENASVSVMDRGFLFGDGVYEVLPAYGGKVLRLEAHLERLENSLHGIKLANPHSRQEWSEVIQSLLGRNGGGEQSIYLQVSRGAADKRDHAFPEAVSPTVFLMTTPIADFAPMEQVKSARAITLEDIRWQRCDLKTVALLGNVLLKQEALDQGYDEAVLVRDGKATECSASNLFAVKGGVLITPPKSKVLLPGITRDLVIELARAEGVEVLEQEIDQTELRDMDELWFSSSTKAIVPIVSLNDHALGQGQPGSVWQTVYGAYGRHIERLKRGEV